MYGKYGVPLHRTSTTFEYCSMPAKNGCMRWKPRSDLRESRWRSISLAVVQTSCIVVELKDRRSSLLTTSFKRSNAVLNATGGMTADANAMVNSASLWSQSQSARLNTPNCCYLERNDAGVWRARLNLEVDNQICDCMDFLINSIYCSSLLSLVSMVGKCASCRRQGCAQGLRPGGYASPVPSQSPNWGWRWRWRCGCGCGDAKTAQDFLKSSCIAIYFTRMNRSDLESAWALDGYIVGLASKPSWKMDNREYTHQPSKRIRLEHSFESRTFSYTTQGGILDEGQDYGVYNQASPRLDLEQAGTVSPSISTYETHHHLTIKHRFIQNNELDHRITTRPESIISSSASAFSAAGAGAGDDCNDGLSNGGPVDQVCFGMVSFFF